MAKNSSRSTKAAEKRIEDLFMLMNKEEVFNFMPHRPPFLFIDTVEKIILPEALAQQNQIAPKDLIGATVVAHFTLMDDLAILAGHFPGNPILPGVIQIEMMAQASAFLSLGLRGIDKTKAKVETLLLGVESSKFRKPIVPGMKIEIRATMTKSRGLMAYYKCEILFEGKRISEASLLARLMVTAKGN
jgi:3-hydroxyacyl-[acyl-carrier-protein] dehydratase